MSAIVFKHIRYKNILSTGDVWTEIDLNTHKSTLVIGTNGAGKSTMLDAICFGLYGKPFRNINKPQLVNSTNKKGLIVELMFKTNGKDYTIKRGIKPNIFEIYENGNMLDQDAAARDSQSYLEETILKMDMKSFGQIVVLGSASFVPFMQLPAQQRRSVIEDLLDIQIFSDMNFVLKDRVRFNNGAIRDCEHNIELIKERIKSAKRHNETIKELKDDHIKQLKESAKPHIEAIDESNEAIKGFENEIPELEHKLVGYSDAKDELREQQSTLNQKNTEMNALKRDSKFFEEHDDCPKCRQLIADEFKNDVVDTNNQNIDTLQGEIDGLEASIKKLESRIEEYQGIEKKIKSITGKINDHNVGINMAKNSLKNIKKAIIKAQEDNKKQDTQEVQKHVDDLNDRIKEQEQLESLKNILSVVTSMLKDGGIKTRIVKQYVPIMNKLINKYLAAMDFFVEFELDENFNETIKSRFRDVFSYSSFSEGEKLRIDLALMFTWREVSRLRNSVSTNILIMDEIMDSSLDDAGTDDFLKIIQDLTDNSNIFIISHKGQQLDDKFQRTIRFNKVKGFSMMGEE